MINKISKTICTSKKGILFFTTRDVKKRTHVGTRFLVNIAFKKVIYTSKKHNLIYLNPKNQ